MCSLDPSALQTLIRLSRSRNCVFLLVKLMSDLFTPVRSRKKNHSLCSFFFFFSLDSHEKIKMCSRERPVRAVCTHEAFVDWKLPEKTLSPDRKIKKTTQPLIIFHVFLCVWGWIVTHLFRSVCLCVCDLRLSDHCCWRAVCVFAWICSRWWWIFCVWFKLLFTFLWMIVGEKLRVHLCIYLSSETPSICSFCSSVLLNTPWIKVGSVSTTPFSSLRSRYTSLDSSNFSL